MSCVNPSNQAESRTESRKQTQLSESRAESRKQTQFIGTNCIGAIVEYLDFKEILTSFRIAKLWYNLHRTYGSYYFRYCYIRDRHLISNSAIEPPPMASALSQYAVQLSLSFLNDRVHQVRYTGWFQHYQFAALQCLSMTEISEDDAYCQSLLRLIVFACPNLQHLSVVRRHLCRLEWATGVITGSGTVANLVPLAGRLKTLHLGDIDPFKLLVQCKQLVTFQWQSHSDCLDRIDPRSDFLYGELTQCWLLCNQIEMLCLNELLFLQDTHLIAIFEQLCNLKHLSIIHSRKLTAQGFEIISKRQLANSLRSLDVAHLASGGAFQLQAIASFPNLRRLCLISHEFLHKAMECSQQLSNCTKTLECLLINSSNPVLRLQITPGTGFFKPFLAFTHLKQLVLDDHNDSIFSIYLNWLDDRPLHLALQLDDLMVLNALTSLTDLSLRVSQGLYLDSPTVLAAALRQFPKLRQFGAQDSVLWSDKYPNAIRRCVARQLDPIQYTYPSNCNLFDESSASSLKAALASLVLTS